MQPQLLGAAADSRPADYEAARSFSLRTPPDQLESIRPAVRLAVSPTRLIFYFVSSLVPTENLVPSMYIWDY